MLRCDFARHPTNPLPPSPLHRLSRHIDADADAPHFHSVPTTDRLTPDAFSGAKLASTGLVNEKLRSRRLELHGPDERVPFEFTGKL